MNHPQYASGPFASRRIHEIIRQTSRVVLAITLAFTPIRLIAGPNRLSLIGRPTHSRWACLSTGPPDGARSEPTLQAQREISSPPPAWPFGKPAVDQKPLPWRTASPCIPEQE